MEYDAEAQISIGQFEYVKICKSVETIADAVEMGKELQREQRGAEGLDESEFRGVVDSLVSGKAVKGGIELWERMSIYQRNVCQEIKKSQKRLEYNKE